MNLREIIRSGLIMNGQNALCGRDCGCHIDDLVPCDEPHIDCEAGWWVHCSVCGKGMATLNGDDELCSKCREVEEEAMR